MLAMSQQHPNEFRNVPIRLVVINVDAELNQLPLKYSLFKTVSAVARSRGVERLTKAAGGSAVSQLDVGLEAARATALAMPDEKLSDLQFHLADDYLRELDGHLREALDTTDDRADVGTIRSRMEGEVFSAELAESPRVALVSMPWQTPAMPSIQLATLAAALDAAGIACDRHELFLDYAAAVGVELYRIIGNVLPFAAEWIFARHYFGPEQGDYLHQFWDERRDSGIFAGSVEEELLDALGPVTERFLRDFAQGVDWGRYEVVGFSLSVSQLASSLALARQIKQLHPDVTIVFGGVSCAGVAGRAILRIAPCVDGVVHVEGEEVLPRLVRQIVGGRSPADIPGVSWREGDRITGQFEGVPVYRGRHERPLLDYDPYFARLRRLGLQDRVQVWLPFEGSRGCWWGERVQCTFCGLHEIMEFRCWEPGDVLAELDRLHTRHGIDRFFAVDLVLPKQFHDTLLAELAERERKFTIFYEVRADMDRVEVQRLADAGVRWIQPGIENLDHDLLRLMRKGTWPAHNIQLLRWCRELGIYPSWSLLIGIPGATLPMYERLISHLPLFFHLTPPPGAGEIQLHRFSPYFQDPESFGIRRTGPDRRYRTVYPVDQQDLDELVYLHEYEYVDPGQPARGYEEALQRTLGDWWEAYARQAVLDLWEQPDGSGVIKDTRRSPEPLIFPLDPAEMSLYHYLDTARVRRTLAEDFKHLDETSYREIGDGFADLLDRWTAAGVIYHDRGRVLALALNGSDKPKTDADLPDNPYF